MAAPLQRPACQYSGTRTAERTDTRAAEPSETSTAYETDQASDAPNVRLEVAELGVLMGVLLVLVWLAGVLV